MCNILLYVLTQKVEIVALLTAENKTVQPQQVLLYCKRIPYIDIILIYVTVVAASSARRKLLLRSECVAVQVWIRKMEFMPELVLEPSQDLPPATPLILLAQVFPTLLKKMQNV